MKKTFFTLFLVALTALLAKEPDALYLTFQQSPDRAITVIWHTEEPTETTVSYHVGKNPHREAHGKRHKIDKVPLYVHTVELKDLSPDTRYTFRVAGGDEDHHFKTLPATLSQDVRFAVGGDAYFYLHLFHKMNQTIAAQNPRFVVIGGDIAYTRGRSAWLRGPNWEVRRWQTFFETYMHDMVTKEGDMIPMLLVLGNHDAKKKGSTTFEDNLLFQFYPFPEQTITYTTLNLGNYASLFLLDTGHIHPIAGTQTVFLKNALKENDAVPFTFALYHVSAYPSYYSFNSRTAQDVRKHWVPLFETHHLTAAFEHHNHTFKRTHRLLQDKPNPQGIPYLGDGSWGVPARIPHTPKQAPYLATSASINAIWLVSLHPDKTVTFDALDINGTTIDTLEAPANTQQ